MEEPNADSSETFPCRHTANKSDWHRVSGYEIVEDDYPDNDDAQYWRYDDWETGPQDSCGNGPSGSRAVAHSQSDWRSDDVWWSPPEREGRDHVPTWDGKTEDLRVYARRVQIYQSTATAPTWKQGGRLLEKLTGV